MHLSHGSAHTYDRSVYHSDGMSVVSHLSAYSPTDTHIFPEEYFVDLIQAYREEIKELYEHGCRRIQFDDAGFCFFCSDAMISSMEGAGADYETLLDTYIKVYNAVTADRPADLITGVHTCRGNMKVCSRRVLARVQVSR